MKRILFILSISLFIISCKKESNIGFLIQGNIDNAQNNTLVKLIRTENRQELILDSTRINGNTFQLKGNVDGPDMYFLTIGGVQGSIPIIVENETIDLTVYADSVFASTIIGGKENVYFDEYQSFVRTLSNRNNKLTADFQAAQQQQDAAKISELRAAYESLMNENNAYELGFMSENPDATLSALILEGNLNGNKYTFNKIKDIYSNFSDSVKDTRAAKTISDFITKNQKLAIGAPAPEFSGPTPNGETIALKDIKGKVTIIDFWAAWCGPCRRENPNVVKVYEKYHDKGLEIIGVSLDGNPKQKGAKDAWLDAIEKDNLTWYHVSNLQYFNDPIAKQFNISSIPATFIIDEEGLIVAKNLRGQALEDKIEELLN
jgi:peroxiredoxin/outer membrane murein-binding lipoprotein Lpp